MSPSLAEQRVHICLASRACFMGGECLRFYLLTEFTKLLEE
jgi:hypothetical protein